MQVFFMDIAGVSKALKGSLHALIMGYRGSIESKHRCMILALNLSGVSRAFIVASVAGASVNNTPCIISQKLKQIFDENKLLN